MAAAVTHIVLAEKIKSRLVKPDQEITYIIGTSFPDIRNISNHARSVTHSYNLTLKDLTGSPFQIGFKLHSLIDQLREEYVVKNGVYELIPELQNHKSALKILEEKLLHNKISNWEIIAKYFDQILPEELDFGVDQQTVEEWHRQMKEHLLEPNNDEANKRFFLNTGRTKEQIDDLISLIHIANNNPQIINIINNFYEEFDSLV